MSHPQNHSWALIYRVAAVAAFLSIAMIPLQILFFIIWPLPTNINDWYDAFAQDWLRGLISMDLLLIVQVMLVALIYLAFAVATFPFNRSLAVLGFASGFMGVALYVPSNTSLELLALSHQYAQAVDPQIANQILAAGRGALATFEGTAFNAYYIVSAIALLLLSSAILKTPHFSRTTAIIGIITGLLMLVPPTIGPFGIAMAFFSLIPWIIFMWMSGRAFLRMAKQS